MVEAPTLIKMNRSVIVFSTGGTILSSATSPSELTNYTCHGTKVNDVLKDQDVIGDCRIEYKELFSIPSSQISLDKWKILVSGLESQLSRPEVVGAVVAHGTDTLEETAFITNLLLKSKKPVIFTGAMRPNSAIGSDGRLNVLNSLRLAISPKSYGRGVLVCLNGKIGEARFVTKTHTLDPATFQCPEYGFCGYVINQEVEFLSRCEKPHTLNTEFKLQDLCHYEFLPYVPIIFSYTEEMGGFINNATEHNAQGIVYCGMGHGSIPPAAEKALTEAKEKGVIIIRASRVGGPVLQSKERWMQKGFIPSGSLSPIKSRLLLSLGLVKFGNNQQEIERIFKTY